MDSVSNKLFSGRYFGYHINMKGSLLKRYRNLFILVSVFSVLCLSPLADIHFELNLNEKAYVHGRQHNETIFPLFIHELLFSHLQHTFDHVTLGTSHQIQKKNQNISSKQCFSSFFVTALHNSNFRADTAHLQKGIAILLDPVRRAKPFSKEHSGLSPPVFSC
jgi:hypothetical protein